MDPVTAVGFAASILTFIDFSWSLVHGSYEIYRSTSGMTAENAHINDVINDLRNVSEDLDGDVLGNSKHEKALKSLASECSDLAGELMALLKKLKRSEKKNSIWTSLRAKWASMRKADEVDSMVERLREFRSEIMLRLNLMLSDQQSSIKMQLEDIRREASELKSVTANKLDDLRTDILSMVAKIQREEDEESEFENETETLTDHVDSKQDTAVENSGIREIQTLLAELVALNKAIPIQHNILKELKFRSMHSREDTIQEAEAGTFEWIFNDVEDDQNYQLEHDEGSELDSSSQATPLEEPLDPAFAYRDVEYGFLTLEGRPEDNMNDDASVQSDTGAVIGDGSVSDIMSPKIKPSPSEPLSGTEAVDENAPLEPTESVRFPDTEAPNPDNRALGREYVSRGSGQILDEGSDDDDDDDADLAAIYDRTIDAAGAQTETISTVFTGASGRDAPWEPRESLDSIVDPIHGRVYERRERVRISSDEIAVVEFPDTSSRDSSPASMGPPSTPSEFVTWLRDGSHIFHILGKAGAGKSTLMKFIFGHPRTYKELEKWAGGKQLVVAHFYFWSSGKEELQMSLDGLYRSILFEVLCQCPDLIQELFPEQWGDITHSVAGHLSSSTVKRAFERLVSKTTNPTHRFCFFIDGLDEFEGDSQAHWEMARLLQAWSRETDIKICSSSRPHTEFIITFEDPHNTIIRLHELTKYDIYRFSCHMFAKDPNVGKLTKEYKDLAWMIVDKAEGVFLWAWLTVRLLLDSIGRRDRPEILKQRLQGVPEGLDDLYERLLGTVLAADRHRSDMMLLVTALNPFTSAPNAMIYAWLDDLGDPGFPLNGGLKPFSRRDINETHDYVQRQLHSLTKGMLELTGYRIDEGEHWERGPFFSKSVQFFHRTARDYLVEFKLAKISESSAHIDLSDAFGRLRLAEYICGMSSVPLGQTDWPYRFLVQTFEYPSSDLSVEIVDSFKAKVEETLAATPRKRFHIPVFFATHGHIEGATDHDFHQPGSWPHFIAAYSQTKYVMHAIQKQPDLLKTQDHGLSILLSALTSGDNELVSKLLDKGASLDDIISMRDITSRRMLVPVWLLATANCIVVLLRGVVFDEWMPDCIALLKDLIRRGVDDNLILTVDETRLALLTRYHTDQKVIRVQQRGPDVEDDDGPPFPSGEQEDNEETARGIAEVHPETVHGVESSCTVRRFLELCEARVPDKLRVTLDKPPPPTQQKPDGESAQLVEMKVLDEDRKDILQSRIFDRESRLSERQYAKIYTSIRWNDEQLGLPFTYRVY